MSSFKTQNKKLQPGTVIIGENGLPVDTIATISSSHLLVSGVQDTLVYSSGTITVPNSVDLNPVRYSKSRYTGRLILRTVDDAVYFIDRVSVNDATKSFNIYTSIEQTSYPASIDLSLGWTIAEAEIVNRLATSSAAKIDQVEFRDMHFQFELDGDPVTVVGEDGELIDFALESTQLENKQELQDINSELDSQTVELQAINANLDSIETKLDSANTSLDNIESDADAMRVAVQSIDSDIDVPLSTRATETTQLSNLGELQDINAELDGIHSDLNSQADETQSILQTEFDEVQSNQDEQTIELQSINTSLTSISNKLDLANTSLDNIESDADSTRIAVQSIDSDIDVALSTRASESTQLNNYSELQAVNSELDGIHSDLNNQFDETQVKQDQQITELQAINSELDTHTTQLQEANASLNDIESRLETLSTGAGATDSNTLRTSSNITRNGNELDYNLGSPTANTVRTASAVSDRSGNGITSRPYGSSVRGLSVSVADGPQIDSFDRVRTSTITSLFNAYFSHSPHSLIFEDVTTGTASVTHSPSTSSMVLAVGTASGDRVVRQTRRYIHYNPGRSYLVTLSGVFGTGLANQTRRWGYFDDSNGLFFQLLGTTLYIVRRTSVSGSPIDTSVSQASFNLDKLDGTGPSGVTINTNTHQLYAIDYVWQGAGRVRFGVVLNGRVIYCHELISDNTLSNPYTRTPALPVRVEVVNTGTTSGASSVNYTCVSVNKESSDDTVPTYVFSSNRGTTTLTVGAGNTAPLFSIRPKLLFAGITNRVPVLPKEAPVISISNPLMVSIVLNATLTGASFVSASANSAVEYDLSASSFTGGEVVKTFYVGGLSGQSAVTNLVQISSILFLGLNIAGNAAHTMTLVVTNLGSGNTSVNAGLVWEEYQ